MENAAMPQHLPLHERKVFAVNALFVQALRRLSVDANDSELDGLRAAVALVADRSHHLHKTADPIDTFLKSSLATIRNICQATTPTLPQLASEVLDEMNRDLHRIACVRCDGGSICIGSRHDDRIVAALDGGKCIEEIRVAFELALDIARCTYDRCMDFDLNSINISLHTHAFGDLESAIPGIPLAASGDTVFEDTAFTKASLIRIGVSPENWNRLSSAALSYIAVHEVLCHAFQFHDAVEERPQRDGIADPISEGMIDCLIADILDEAAKGLSGMEQVLAQGAAAVARRIHLARASGDSAPPFLDWKVVAQGSAAFKAIVEIYTMLPEPGRNAREDAIILTAQLNLHSWDFATRAHAITKFDFMVRKRHKNRTLIKLLGDFRRTFDATPIIDFLSPV